VAPLLCLYPVSVLFISTGSRGDQFVYGRYVDVALPLVVALGLAGLLRVSGPLRRRLLLLVGVPMATLVGSHLVAEAVGRSWLRAPFNSVNTINILWYTRSGALSLGEGTAVCVLALLLIGAMLVLRDRATRSAGHPRLAVARASAIGVAGIVLAVFSLQLSRVPTLNDLLAFATRDPRAISRAISDRGIHHVVFDRDVGLGDRLAIQYWTPDVDSTTSTGTSCGLVVVPSTHTPSGASRTVVTAGRLALLDVPCG
jgi:hypothetical protein